MRARAHMNTTAHRTCTSATSLPEHSPSQCIKCAFGVTCRRDACRQRIDAQEQYTYPHISRRILRREPLALASSIGYMCDHASCVIAHVHTDTHNRANVRV